MKTISALLAIGLIALAGCRSEPNKYQRPVMNLPGGSPPPRVEPPTFDKVFVNTRMLDQLDPNKRDEVRQKQEDYQRSGGKIPPNF